MMDSTVGAQQVAIIRSMGGLVFDAVFEEQHQSDLEVTDNPIETGVVVSDHAYMKPLTVTLSAGVSDTPLQWFVGGTDNNGEYKDFVRQDDKDPFKSDSSRTSRAFELLTDLQKKAEPFNLQTGLRLYKNMVCTSIRTIQDKDTANTLVFEATLREVLIVFTQSIKYEPTPKKGATSRQAATKKAAGQQSGKQVIEEKKKSGLKSLLDLVRNGKK